MENSQITYEEVCRYVGRLFLESQREIERLAQAAANTTPTAASLRENLVAEQRKVAVLEEQVRKLTEGQ